MRILFKVILFPLSLALTVFTAVFGFIVGHAGRLLNILSFLIFLLSAAVLVMSLFDGSKVGIQSGIIGGAAAFIISPYGLPLLAEAIIGGIDRLNDAIKSI
jgi:hypothetical protein